MTARPYAPSLERMRFCKSGHYLAREEGPDRALRCVLGPASGKKRGLLSAVHKAVACTRKGAFICGEAMAIRAWTPIMGRPRYGAGSVQIYNISLVLGMARGLAFVITSIGTLKRRSVGAPHQCSGLAEESQPLWEFSTAGGAQQQRVPPVFSSRPQPDEPAI